MTKVSWQNHDSEDKGVNEMVTPGGTQKVVFINESEEYLKLRNGVGDKIIGDKSTAPIQGTASNAEALRT